MKAIAFPRALIAITFAVLLAAKLSAADADAASDSPREHLSLDANWKFHLGDDWPRALNLAKAGASTGPAADRFNDAAWRSLDLPHDWAIELPFDRTADRNHGFKPVGPGFPENSVGWYRRTFAVSKADQGKRLWLTFDGAFRDSTVWVNGWLVSRHESGYYPIREDITDVVHYGGTNVISVRVDAGKFEGWFYEGAGIYRHVWLDKTAPIALAPDGLFVYSQFKNNVPSDKAEIHVEATVLNTLTNATTAAVNCEILSPEGKSVARFHAATAVAGEADATAKLTSKVASPVLWSPESPKLYTMVTTVTVNGKEVDRKETTFGIRTVGFDKDKGFLLNGKPYVIQGTCNHQDHAGVGAAIPDALEYFRIAKLKEFGDNAYRTSHNPPTPELLEACDHLGMIVMDESRLLGSDSENLHKWDVQIRRDRNHPSVCLWSICNEEPQQSSSEGGRVGAAMLHLVKRLDPTRPVTAAENIGDVFSGIMGELDVRGWNYHTGADMDKYHAEHPGQPNVGSETASTVTTRGIYADDAQHGYVRAYDDRGTESAEKWWSYYAARPWLSGGFVWTGFDYRGEPTPYSWPCISSHFGIVDTCGFPKDLFYYYQAWWTPNPVLHLLPHWNWPGKEGQEIRVDAFSNCKSVELFLNGASLGKQDMQPNSKLTWQVKYAPGTLSAKGFDATGKLIAETKVETTGDATQIQLTPDRKTINADGTDVSVFTVAALDAQGRVVPVAQNHIQFSLAGAGKIIGVGNGDPSCHEPDVFIPQAPVRKVVVTGWRWKTGNIPTRRGETAPEFAADFNDSAWPVLGPNETMALGDGESGFFRAHVQLTAEDLANPGVRIRFNQIESHGWINVNGERAGESFDRRLPAVFEIKHNLHVGDNVIAVGVRNDGSKGGLNQDVDLEIVGEPQSQPWSRSLFNGLAQILVQSTKEAGEIKLSATADGLQSATSVVQAQPCTPKPAVP